MTIEKRLEGEVAQLRHKLAEAQASRERYAQARGRAEQERDEARAALDKARVAFAEEQGRVQVELGLARADLTAVKTDAGGVWFWQGDGWDHPESLTCPVVMRAEVLREFIADRQALAEARAEVERLRGLHPELPPRPPDGGGMPRYGLRWNGPNLPLAVPMADGYWTPWHLANAEVERLRARLAQEEAQSKATCDYAGKIAARLARVEWALDDVVRLCDAEPEIGEALGDVYATVRAALAAEPAQTATDARDESEVRDALGMGALSP